MGGCITPFFKYNFLNVVITCPSWFWNVIYCFKDYFEIKHCLVLCWNVAKVTGNQVFYSSTWQIIFFSFSGIRHVNFCFNENISKIILKLISYPKADARKPPWVCMSQTQQVFCWTSRELSMILKGADYHRPVVLSLSVTARSFRTDASIKQTNPLRHSGAVFQDSLLQDGKEWHLLVSYWNTLLFT